MSSPDPRTWFTEADLPWIERPDFTERAEYRSASPAQQQLADAYHRRGCVVLPSVADATLRRAVIAALDPHFRRTGAPQLTDSWSTVEAVRHLAVLPPVLEALSFLYGRRPIPFRTVDFRVGTEQRPHSDAIHFNSLPPRFVCGVWIALEDVGLDQGPLSYHPGSHRLPEVSPAELDGLERFDYRDYERHIATTLARASAGPALFSARAGDALVWSANLVHGGATAARPGATRWSQVTHYGFAETLVYAPLRSDLATGELAVCDPLVDIGTGRLVRPRIDGGPARSRPAAEGRRRLVRDDGTAPADLSRVARAKDRVGGAVRVGAGLARPRLARWTRRRPAP